MKLLILVIYSDSKEYQEMLKIQRSYLHHFPNVQTFFIHFRKQPQPIEVEDDFIYVNGTDSYLNITLKTIESLVYALYNINFDYIIRTNMSTLINIPLLYDFCLQLPKTNVYTSGNMLNLQWLEVKANIKDKSLFGTLFASGTSIIMSKDVVNYLVQHKSKIRYDIVDDISIGIFMSTYLPSAYYPQTAQFWVVPKNVKPNQIPHNIVFFRNRAYKNRSKDIPNMRIVRNVLMKRPLALSKKKYKKFTRKCLV
jgi:hypothetical protein